jgi:hypothetical protein
MRMLVFIVALIGAAECSAQADIEKASYLRPAQKGFDVECRFRLIKTMTGSSIQSVTQRGKMTLTVTSRHDEGALLIAAEATLVGADTKKTATVTVAAGKAKIQRAGQAAQEFDVPQGVIVTSAPDWTDTFLLCRRYDRKAGGKQSFPGLWIHVEQPSQRLTFAIERNGNDTIDRAGKNLTLDRCTIWLRGNSMYAAWMDDAGLMIKLVPLPYKEDAQNWIVLNGYEKSTAKLRPK